MLILSETPSRHERCTCCSKVMISQVSIPQNHLPLRTHFCQLIAKAPVEQIYGCFLFHTQFSRCSGSQWILRSPRSAKKHSLCTTWGVKLSRKHTEHWSRESFHALVGLSFSHLQHSDYPYYPFIYPYYHCIYLIKIQICDKPTPMYFYHFCTLICWNVNTCC